MKNKSKNNYNTNDSQKEVSSTRKIKHQLSSEAAINRSIELLSNTAKSINTDRIRDIISNFDKKPKVTRKTETKPLTSRLEFKRHNKGSGYTKSTVLNSAFMPTEVKKATQSSQNEYGLGSQRTYRKNTKSFNDSYIISSVNNEKPLLKPKEIDRYMSMLSNYILNDQDTKTITTLKILLNHFTRKNNQKDF